jgi:hypothetical protein
MVGGWVVCVDERGVVSVSGRGRVRWWIRVAPVGEQGLYRRRVGVTYRGSVVSIGVQSRFRWWIKSVWSVGEGRIRW